MVCCLCRFAGACIGSSSKEREIVSMINAAPCSDDLCDARNYSIMKSYIPRLLRGVVTPRDVISCKEHRVPWAALRE